MVEGRRESSTDCRDERRREKEPRGRRKKLVTWKTVIGQKEEREQ